MVPGDAVGKEEVLELKNELEELKEAGYKFKKEFDCNCDYDVIKEKKNKVMERWGK